MLTILNRMKFAIAAGAILVAVSSFADTFTTNTVEGLVWLLRTYNGESHVIELAVGDYCLRDADAWDTDSTWGTSLLYCNKIRIKGMGANPEATRLIGSGSYRVLHLAGSGTIENLTVTNGYAHKDGVHGNSGFGGATYGGVITNCVLIGNKADEYGGASSGSYVARGCKYLNNTSAYGGAVQGGDGVYNSILAFNSATSQGGAGFNVARFDGCTIISNKSASYGAVWKCSLITNCLIACNAATGNTGGIYLHTDDVCVDCVVSNNTSSTGTGGVNAQSGRTAQVRKCTIIGNSGSGNGAASGILNCRVFDSQIVSNRLVCASSSTVSGGAVNNCLLSNCVVAANFSTNGMANITAPGVYNCTAYSTEICGNCCAGGSSAQACAAGVSSSTLYDCSVHDNYSTHMAGGVRDSIAYRCQVCNNLAPSTGPNALSSKFVDCTVSGSTVCGGTAVGTVFRDVGRAVTLVGNPYVDATRTSSTVFEGIMHVTNCLFAGNCFAEGAGSIFYGNASGGGHVTSCTIVSNRVRSVFRDFSCATANPCFVENTLMFGNGYVSGSQYVSCDFGGLNCTAGGIRLDVCAYGVSGNASFADFVGLVYKFGETDGVGSALGAKTPRFAMELDPAHPFGLRTSSAVRGKGVVQGWMATATDIRGADYPRLRDGKVDIGCYQCWMNPSGICLIVR